MEIKNIGGHSKGSVLLESAGKTIPCEMKTQKFDKQHYADTGKVRYLGEGSVSIPTSELENERRMKSEIKTIKDFEKIGSYQTIARLFHVNVLVARGLMRKLLKSERKKENEAKRV